MLKNLVASEERYHLFANITLIVSSVIAAVVGITITMPVEEIFTILLGLGFMRIGGHLLKNVNAAIVASLAVSLLVTFFMYKEGSPFFGEERSFFFFIANFCSSWIITLISRCYDDDLMNPIDIVIFIIYSLGALCAGLLSTFDKV